MVASRSPMKSRLTSSPGWSHLSRQLQLLSFWTPPSCPVLYTTGPLHVLFHSVSLALLRCLVEPFFMLLLTLKCVSCTDLPVCQCPCQTGHL